MQEVVAERFNGVDICTFCTGKLILPVDRSLQMILKNDHRMGNMIIGKFESILIEFENLVAWKRVKIANFSIFRVTYDCRKQRNVNKMRLKVPNASTLTLSLSF